MIMIALGFKALARLFVFVALPVPHLSILGTSTYIRGGSQQAT